MQAGATSPPDDDVQPLVRIEGVSKRFGDVVAVDDVSIDIAPGEFFALLGPSGCGKTTLLRMLAGFETPDAGRILLDGEDIAEVLPHRRPVNMMFQNYALFPHLNVRDNIAFGLKRTSLPRAEIADRVAEMMGLVQLEGLDRRKPDQLSGGQRQRVALARALARRPRLLLLDEPLAALDKKLREATQAELMQLQRKLGTSFVIVTHDQDEAMTMADRIAVMRDGKIEQIGSPRALYETPASQWIAGFIGDVNLIEGRVIAHGNDELTIAAKHDFIRVVAAADQVPRGADVVVAVRPEKLRLMRVDTPRTEATPHRNARRGTIASVGYLGDQTVYGVAPDDSGAPLRATLANTARRSGDDFAVGERVIASFAPADAVVLVR